ncbi:MAG TPA: ROK family protein [Verrucomicrobiae bacterium]|nr:ROK family protein [Verrucomicrobiae bacterium]
MKTVLVIDIGGTNVKFVATGHKTPRRFPSGPKMTPRRMVAEVKRHTADWKYDVVSIGYPGVVKRGRIVVKPQNLGAGWVGFDFQAAFGRPVKLMNDAAMQALGSYRGGLMLFLGLGTGLGSALIADGVVVPLELAHLSYKHGTYEDYVGFCGLKHLGRKKWRRYVADVAERFIAALRPDDVVLGGGGAKHLKRLPKGCRLGGNTHAFLGGFRLWDEASRSGRQRS